VRLVVGAAGANAEMARIDAERRLRTRGSALRRARCDGGGNDGVGEKTATVEGYGSASFARGYSSPAPARLCRNEPLAHHHFVFTAFDNPRRW